MAVSVSIVFSEDEKTIAPSVAEDVPTTKELSGKIIEIKPEESTLSVEYLRDKNTEVYEKVILMVTSLSEIVKDAVDISFSDLKVGDQVSIQYMTDAEGKKIVSSLWAENGAAAEVSKQGGV